MIHAAGTQALDAGATVHGVLEVGRALAESVPVVLMCYANLVLARGTERFAADLAERGISGLIVPDLPLEEAGDVLAACDAAGVALVAARRARRRPTERLAAIGASRARVRLHGLGHRHDRRAPGLVGRPARRSSPARRRNTDVPVALGFGIGTPEAAAAAADAGADGVIVGSRLVRAAAEAAEPAGRGARAGGPVRRRAPVASAPAWGCSSPRSPPRRLDRPVGARRKPFDGLLVTILMILIAGTAHVFTQYAPAAARRGTRAAATSRANAPLTGDLLRGLRRDE